MLPTHRMQERCHFSEITAEESAACDWHVNCLGRQAGRHLRPPKLISVPADKSRLNSRLLVESRAGTDLLLLFLPSRRRERIYCSHFYLSAVERGENPPVFPFLRSSREFLLHFLRSRGRARRKCFRISVPAVEKGLIAPVSTLRRSSRRKMINHRQFCAVDRKERALYQCRSQNFQLSTTNAFDSGCQASGTECAYRPTLPILRT